ncbi:MAG: hypothetical protein GY737_10595, partial [Desulfobacteraceae bacterium]|nr:hypothetical protein [Desulfobacteraceae bacterium]
MDDEGNKRTPTIPRKSASLSKLPTKVEQQRSVPRLTNPMVVKTTELMVDTKTKTFKESGERHMEWIAQTKTIRLNKQQKLLAEQQQAEEEYPRLPIVENPRPVSEVSSTPEVPAGTAPYKTARLVQMAQVIMLNGNMPNWGLPDTANTRGMDQLKWKQIDWHVTPMDIGYGYHVTTNPALICGWSQQHNI